MFASAAEEHSAAGGCYYARAASADFGTAQQSSSLQFDRNFESPGANPDDVSNVMSFNSN